MKSNVSNSVSSAGVALPGLAQQYLNRERVRLISGGFVVTGLVLVVISFATAKENHTIFGTPLGSDFTAMYVAGTLLNEYGTTDLYDFALQHEIRRSVLPGLPDWNQLPYLYAPWFASIWRPLAALPYQWACFTWLIVSPLLFLGGFWLLSRTCTHIGKSDIAIALLVGLSFEPFLFETWVNGQVSSIPFFAVCLSLWLHKQDRPFLGGMALAVLFYKPTQPLLIVLMLLAGCRWRTLCGIATAGAVLTVVTALQFGPQIVVEYPQTLLNYREWIATNQLELPRAKYVDVKSSSHLLGAPWELPALIGLGALAVFMTYRLAQLWRQAPRGWDAASQHAWAATLVAAPVLNFYFAVYDAIILIPGLVLAFELWLSSPTRGESRCGPLLALAALVYAAGLLVPLNETLRVDLFTYALLYVAWRMMDRKVVGFAEPPLTLGAAQTPAIPTGTLPR